jgi:hypothetical protein
MSKATPPRAKRILIVLQIVGAVLMAFGSIVAVIGYGDYQDAKEIMQSGLNPPEINMANWFTIMLGNQGSGVMVPPQNLESGVDLDTLLNLCFKGYNFSGDNFRISVVNNKLSVSGEIKNSDNVTVAQIYNNNWKSDNPDKTFDIFDRNYNDYAFEIIGKTGVPVIQIIIFGSNKIQIGGLFHSDAGEVYILPTEFGSTRILNPTDDQLRSQSIMKIFQYPSSSNLGKMVNPAYPSSDPLSESWWIMILGIIMIFLGAILALSDKIYEFYKSSNE